MEGDKGTAEIEEGFMNCLQTLTADYRSVVECQFSQSALRQQTMSLKVGLVLAPRTRGADADAAPRQGAPAAAHAVAFVDVLLQGALAPSTIRLCSGRDAGDQCLEDRRIRVFHPDQPFSYQEDLPVSHRMVIRARLAAAHQAWAGYYAPFLIWTLTLDRLTRDWSIWFASLSRSGSARCGRCCTPAA